ncbi:P-loop containing nucleoside triphosphate hydrolases superfamily protein [Hirschfeldia incana]|nr:P-loop containing nucleoside triphosphate hydrolases superfamily protein [Hirschfeldia incana]
MYTRAIKRNQGWGLVLQQAKYYLVRPTIRDYTVSRSYGLTTNNTNLTRGSLFRSFSPSVASRNSLRLSKNIQLRSFSSEGEDKHVSLNKGSDLGGGKTAKESSVGHLDSHAQLGEQDQIEWLNSEKLASECKKKESPLLSRRERFKEEFLRRVQPWEKIQLSWETFPYYIHDHTKNILVECVTSHIRQKDAASVYGSRLDSSSGRILLQGLPGTDLYQERLVRALARDVQVPLLVLDSNVLAPYDFSDEYNEDSESDGENAEAEADDGTTESEAEEDSGANSEEDSEAKADGSDNEEARLEVTEEDLKKIVPKLEELGELVAEELHGAGGASEAAAVEHSDRARRPARKGDRVKYVGPSKKGDAKHSPLTTGQRGEIFEVNGNRVAVVFDKEGDTSSEGSEKKPKKQSQKPLIHWIDVKDLKHDLDMQAEDGYIALKALSEVLQSTHPLIVYFPDSSRWLSRAVPKAKRNEFVDKVEEMFDKVSGPVVMICGRNKIETASKGREKFTMILPNFGRIARLPLPLKHLTEGLSGSKSPDDNEIYKLFTNVMNLLPPKEEDILAVFNKQLVEDRRIVVSRSNLNEILKALEENELLCTDLYQVNTDDVILTKQRAEKVVGWARNHYLSSCSKPSIKEDRLILPRESIEISVKRLKAQEDISRKPSHSLKNIAKDEFESNFVSAVVAPEEIGVKFDDVGALEHVKKTLNELVILPMRRPELFTRGNLLRPCKGILLFGPPGTGKTLLAKALATEAGANFISITGSSLTSKWFGDAEKLTKALFSFASKLAPVIIFVDEVDSLLGARGGSHEHEATRRMRNEFMAAWDGLRSKDSQRILILGATNRPFDLDDAVIRRLPRRIYVDLPDAENRLKILKIFLTPENLETGFEYEKLAKETEGYSGSDLKNLCIAAAYRPVQELLQEENKGSVANGAAPDLRPLSLDDFIQSKAKVSPSVSYDATTMNELRKWNEQYGEGGSRTKSPFGF